MEALIAGAAAVLVGIFRAVQLPQSLRGRKKTLLIMNTANTASW